MFRRRKFEIKKKKNIASWWLNQPIWNILVKMGIISPGKGENKKYC